MELGLVEEKEDKPSRKRKTSKAAPAQDALRRSFRVASNVDRSRQEDGCHTVLDDAQTKLLALLAHEAEVRAQESNCEEAQLQRLRDGAFWAQLGFSPRIAASLTLVGREVSIPWVREHGESILTRHAGFDGHLPLGASGAVITLSARVVAYSAPNGAHLVSYNTDGVRLWDHDLECPSDRTSRAAARQAEREVDAAATVSPFTVYEGDPWLGLPSLRARWGSVAATPLTLPLPRPAGWPLSPLPEGGVEGLLRDDDRAFVADHLDASMATRMFELIDACVANVVEGAPPLAVAHKMRAVMGNALLILGADISDSKKADIAIMETSPIAGFQRMSAILCCGMPRSGNSHSVDEYVPHRQRSRDRLTCSTKGTGKSVFGVATHLLTLILLRSLRGVQALRQQLLVRPKQLERAVLREWRDDVIDALESQVRDAECAALQAKQTLQALACVLAFAHDAGDASPLKGTIMACLWQDNGWQKNQATALLCQVCSARYRARTRHPYTCTRAPNAVNKAPVHYTGATGRHHRCMRQPLGQWVLGDQRCCWSRRDDAPGGVRHEPSTLACGDPTLRIPPFTDDAADGGASDVRRGERARGDGTAARRLQERDLHGQLGYPVGA